MVISDFYNIFFYRRYDILDDNFIINYSVDSYNWIYEKNNIEYIIDKFSGFCRFIDLDDEIKIVIAELLESGSKHMRDPEWIILSNILLSNGKWYGTNIINNMLSEWNLRSI